jgi:hypothetical protein
MKWETISKVTIYLITIWVMLDQGGFPVLLWVKRLKFLGLWSLAAALQKSAIASYEDYKEEVELNG